MGFGVWKTVAFGLVNECHEAGKFPFVRWLARLPLGWLGSVAVHMDRLLIEFLSKMQSRCR